MPHNLTKYLRKGALGKIFGVLCTTSLHREQSSARGLTIVVGIWLSISGKPYNTSLFTIHELLALAMVVFLVILLINLFKNGDVKSNIFALVIIAGLSIIVIFVTGALLSIGRMPYALMKTIHIIATILAIGTSTAVVKLLVGIKI